RVAAPAPEFAAALLDLLTFGPPERADAPVDAIARFQDPQTISRLASIAGDDGMLEQRRIAAVNALGAMISKQAIEQLLTIARDQPALAPQAMAALERIAAPLVPPTSAVAWRNWFNPLAAMNDLEW